MGIVYNGGKVNDHFHNQLTLFHQNIRGLSNKSEEIINFLMDKELNPNVMCFTEHHIPELSPGFINLENYILGASFSRCRYQKGGVCIFVQKDLFFNCVDLSKFCEEKTVELCAIQLESQGKHFVILCVYRAPSGDFNLFLQLFDEALKSLYTPKVEFLICGDLNTDYLSNSSRKEQFSILLNTYNMSHTVNFPTRSEKNHVSAIDNIFVQNSRLLGCMVFPSSNSLSDHDAQCIIFNKFFIKKRVVKNKFRKRLITKDTISTFQKLLSNETWDDIYNENYINDNFNTFLKTFINIFEASFPVAYLHKNKDNGWITKGIKISCKRK
jgi:hypothetical protein